MGDPLKPCTTESLLARLEALDTMLNEREDRTKERFASMKIAVDAALAAADRAVTKAEIATEKRFEGVNEFRETLRDQAANLMPRMEYEVQHRALSVKVDEAIKRLAAIETVSLSKKEGLGTVGAIVLGIIAAVTALATIGTVVAVLIVKH